MKWDHQICRKRSIETIALAFDTQLENSVVAMSDVIRYVDEHPDKTVRELDGYFSEDER